MILSGYIYKQHYNTMQLQLSKAFSYKKCTLMDRNIFATTHVMRILHCCFLKRKKNVFEYIVSQAKYKQCVFCFASQGFKTLLKERSSSLLHYHTLFKSSLNVLHQNTINVYYNRRFMILSNQISSSNISYGIRRKSLACTYDHYTVL